MAARSARPVPSCPVQPFWHSRALSGPRPSAVQAETKDKSCLRGLEDSETQTPKSRVTGKSESSRPRHPWWDEASFRNGGNYEKKKKQKTKTKQR